MPNDGSVANFVPAPLQRHDKRPGKHYNIQRKFISCAAFSNSIPQAAESSD
jgi:hypothetical protein